MSVLTKKEINAFIEYWVPIVNAEIGRSDTNKKVIEHFKEISNYPNFQFCFGKHWYAVILKATNYWGDKEVHLYSCYVHPEHRKGGTCLREIIRTFKQIANEYGAKYLYAGWHLDPKFGSFLEKIGFKAVGYRYENKIEGENENGRTS